MTNSHAVSPSSAQVEATILDLQVRFPDWVVVRTVGRSVQGRPLYSVTVTDPRVPPQDKQHVLVLAGQHGEEESGRMTALSLLEWLTHDQATAVRRSQKIVVMPNVNPDGAEADTSATAAGVNLNKDHAPSGPTSPEAKAVAQVAEELQPDAVADLHCRGFAGHSFDMVLYPWTRPYTEDGRCLARLAEEMAAAGEAAGLPHVVHPLTWPGWWENIPADQEPHTLSFMYRRFKSLCVLTETSESNQHCAPAALRQAVGLARLRALLDWGQRKHPGSYYPGYPLELVTNLTVLGITATGATAQQRRRSRVEIWRNAPAFRSLTTDRPEAADRKRLRCCYQGPQFTAGAGLQFRTAGRWTVAGAQLNGRELAPSEVDGFLSWQDPCSTFVRANLPCLTAGDYELNVQLRP
jgi:hypothetical protein